MDSGVFEGSEISMYYDPMICKLITFADAGENSRAKAIELMNRALDHYLIRGLSDNVSLHRNHCSLCATDFVCFVVRPHTSSTYLYLSRSASCESCTSTRASPPES